MKMRPKTINDRYRAKRDIFKILSDTKDKLSRKDLVLSLSVQNGSNGSIGFPYSAMIYALRELEKEGKIERSWGWGVAGNWEYRYSAKRDN